MSAVRALPRGFASKVSPNRIGKKGPVRSVPQQRTARPARPWGAGSAGPNVSIGWRTGGERAVQRRLQPSSLTAGRPMEHNVLRQEVNSLKNKLQNVNELCRSLLDRQDNFEKTFKIKEAFWHLILDTSSKAIFVIQEGYLAVSYGEESYREESKDQQKLTRCL